MNRKSDEYCGLAYHREKEAVQSFKTSVPNLNSSKAKRPP